MKTFKKTIALVLALAAAFAIAAPALAGSATVGALNVRKGPGSSYATTGGQIAKNSTFNILFEVTGTTVTGSTSKKWYYVDEIRCACGSSTCNAPFRGYIHSSFVSGSVNTDRPTTQVQAFGTALIKLGAMGGEVYNVQLVLYAQGLLSSLDACDGLYGAKTVAAVKAFQVKEFLDDDGIVGPDTAYHLWCARFYPRNPSASVLANYGAKCW